MSQPFIAEIKIFAGNFALRGWAFCDGQLLPIAQNTALFSLIGTTYGGDGRTTTALPNLQDRAAMHPGRGPGLTSRKLGQRMGSDTETLTEAQLPTHTHTLRAVSTPGAPTAPASTAALSRGLGVNLYQSNTTANLVDLASATLSTNGSSQAHNNEQPYLTLNFIIALVGTFPSRS